MFTLIIPYHNRERFLPRTLHSLLQSTVQPSQIILVDNASTDASRQVCEQFACEHPDCPIQLIAESKPGACHARNKALQMVTEEWVYFFDSDDELSPDYFQAVSRQVQQHPSADMIACATVRVYPDGRRAPREVQYSADPVDQILSGQLVTQGMFLKNRPFLQRIGGWNGHLPRWNDWELGLRALLHNPRVVWLKDKPYHSVYEHAESITGTDIFIVGSGIAYRLADSSLRGWHPKPMLVCVGLPQLYIGRQFCPRKQHRKRKSGKTARQCHAEQTVMAGGNTFLGACSIIT